MWKFFSPYLKQSEQMGKKGADIAGFRADEACAGYSCSTLPALWAQEVCWVLGCAAQESYRDKESWAAGSQGARAVCKMKSCKHQAFQNQELNSYSSSLIFPCICMQKIVSTTTLDCTYSPLTPGPFGFQNCLHMTRSSFFWNEGWGLQINHMTSWRKQLLWGGWQAIRSWLQFDFPA